MLFRSVRVLVLNGPLPLPQVRFSSQSLFDHLKEIQQDRAALGQFENTLLSIFRDHLHNDRYTHTHALPPRAALRGSCLAARRVTRCSPLRRVSIPFLKMLDQMLANSCFEIFTSEDE